jgi:hypothetical protein
LSHPCDPITMLSWLCGVIAVTFGQEVDVTTVDDQP